MLLFHGTSGPRAKIKAIFDEGLRPHGGRTWAHEMTSVEEHVFACTSPVGSRDGDPIRFAQRGAWKRNAAWIVVLDVPRDSDLVVGAIANGELAQFWSTQTFAASVLTKRLGHARTLIAAARAAKRDVRDMLTYYVSTITPGIAKGEPDAASLVQFEAAFLRANFADKARVARSFNLDVPTDFLEDSHYATCAGCMYQLFDVGIEAAGIRHEGAPIAFNRGSFHKIDLATFATHLEALGRWLGAYSDDHVDRVLGRRQGLTLRELQAALPPPSHAVPRTMWPDLATAQREWEPDMQLLLHAVPSEHIVGAIEIGTRDELSSLVRPRDGETLPNTLLHLANELRDRRDPTGRPVLLEA